MITSAWYNQAIDQAPFVLATGAAYKSLHHPSRFAIGIRDAFLQAKTERRPVVVGIPFDLAESPATADATLPAPSRALDAGRSAIAARHGGYCRRA